MRAHYRFLRFIYKETCFSAHNIFCIAELLLSTPNFAVARRNAESDECVMSRNLVLILLFVWLLAIASGISCLARYESTPGKVAAPADVWPDDCRLPRFAHAATLVMLVHPRCPCTNASLTELARIIAVAPRPLTVYVLFYKPSGAPEGWEKTALYDKAVSLPGVTVLADEGGALTRRFHALTSGQVCFYDAAGLLRFSGGITFARGQAGDNAGAQALNACFVGQRELQKHTPVFGCSLLDPVSTQRRGSGGSR